jgi:Rha family phage regulatory protein
MNTALLVTEPNFENNLVSVFDGTPTTTSLVVAEKFGKTHKSVVEAIVNLKDSIDQVKSDVKTEPIFRTLEIIKKNSIGRTFHTKYFVLDRNAFSLLVFGFTGEKALKFKLQFLDAFNDMEALLREHREAGLIDPNDTNALISAVALKLECKTQPSPMKKTKTKRKKSVYGRTSLSVTCGKLGLRPRVVLNQLIEEGVIRRVEGLVAFATEDRYANFFEMHGKAVHVKPKGVAYFKERIAAGNLPVKCFKSHKPRKIKTA